MKDFSPHLKLLRKKGSWLHLSTDDAYQIVDAWRKTGQPFSEAIARLDLTYWMDQGDVKPVRYYVERWGMTYYRVQKMMAEFRVFDDPADVESELEQTDQPSIRNQSRINRKSITDQSENADSGKNSNGDRSQINQESITDQSPVNQHYQTSDLPEEEEENEGDAGPESMAWSSEAVPVIRAWVEWHGRETFGPAIQRTLQLLMVPRGSPAGAWISDDPARTKYNGFSADEVIAGIAAMAQRQHHSPDSLVRHVAGLMPAAGEKHGKGTQRTDGGSGQRPATEYQQRRQIGTSVIDSRKVVNFATRHFGGVDTELEERRRGGRTGDAGHGADPRDGPDESDVHARDDGDRRMSRG